MYVRWERRVSPYQRKTPAYGAPPARRVTLRAVLKRSVRDGKAVRQVTVAYLGSISEDDLQAGRVTRFLEAVIVRLEQQIRQRKLPSAAFAPLLAAV